MSSPERTAATNRPGEHGAAMILALAFLIVIGVLAAALIGFAFTGSATTRVYREQRVVRYNAESAVNLTIVRLKLEPTRGVDPTAAGTPDCSSTFPMSQDTSSGAQQIIAPGSILTVQCGPITSASDPYKPIIASGGLDTDGGQAPRTVTITVRCIGPDRPPGNRAVISCTGSGPSNRVVARARVRFDVDYAVANKSQRAVVPKILTFDSKR